MQFQSAASVEGPIIERLAALKAGNDFAESLVAQWRDRGALSDKQWHWVKKPIAEAEEAKVPKQKVDFSALLELLQATGLKQPKVFLLSDKGELAFKVAGHQARVPGVVNILVDGVWIGRVNLDGGLFLSTRQDIVKQDWLIERVDAFLADPEAAAKAYGQATSSCCFCHEELSDERSVAAGYGPICAGRYGLPWGDLPQKEDD